MDNTSRVPEKTLITRVEKSPVIGSAAIYLLGAVLLLGIGWPISRFAVTQGASPVWLAWARTCLSCIVAIIFLAYFRLFRTPQPRDIPAIAALGCLQIAGYFLLSYSALAWMPAGRTAILSNATTIWIAPLSVLILNEKIPRWRWVGVAFGLAGVLIMVGPWAINWSEHTEIVSVIYLLAAALVWALAIVLLRKFPPPSSAVSLLPWSFGTASVIMLPFAMNTNIGTWNGPAIASLLGLGVLFGPLSVYCAIQAQSRLPALISGMGMLCCPVVGIAIASVWLKEALTYDLIFGSTFIILGTAFGFVRSMKRHSC